jgi:mitogen-activated protein kinase kinase kinase
MYSENPPEDSSKKPTPIPISEKPPTSSVEEVASALYFMDARLNPNSPSLPALSSSISENTKHVSPTVPDDSDQNLSQSQQLDIDDIPREHKERVHWRTLLNSVLKSDIYKTEKRRLSTTIQLDCERMYKMWIEIRAVLSGKNRATQELYLEQARAQINPVLEEVMNFEVQPEGEVSPFNQVTHILNKVDIVESFYPSTKMLKEKKVIYASPSFQYNLDVLTSWWKLTKSLKTHLEIVKSWTGSATQGNTEEGSSGSSNAFRDRVLKETDLSKMFKNSIIVSLSPLLLKAKQLVLEHREALQKMKLPLYVEDFQQLKSFPIKLLCEYLKLRILYVDMLKEANAFVFEETLDEVRVILSFAATFKKDYQNLKLDLPGQESTDEIEEEYEALLLESLNVYLKLISFKISASTKARLDSTDYLMNEWNALRKQYYVAEGGHSVAGTHIWYV